MVIAIGSVEIKSVGDISYDDFEINYRTGGIINFVDDAEEGIERWTPRFR